MNKLPPELVMIILKKLTGAELAQLAMTSRRYRAMINADETLRNRIRTNKNWAFMNERELRSIAKELRENEPSLGYHLKDLLARYNKEIARRNRMKMKKR
jgi:hypothetical protein